MDTGDGHVTATIEPGSVMKSNGKVSTGDGRVRADLHDAGNLDNHRNDLRARLGEGGKLFSIRSGDGSIHLTQR